MGVVLSNVSGFDIHITTADRKEAGVSDGIFLVLKDKYGGQSKVHDLDRFLVDAFRRGRTATFHVDDETERLSDIVGIEVWRDGKRKEEKGSWLLEKIIVERVKPVEGQKAVSMFPITRWIHPNLHMHFMEYDTCLPQFDPFPLQRKKDILMKRDMYEFECSALGPPVVSAVKISFNLSKMSF